MLVRRALARMRVRDGMHLARSAVRVIEVHVHRASQAGREDHGGNGERECAEKRSHVLTSVPAPSARVTPDHENF